MNLDGLFIACNSGILPFWALLVLAPRARLTTRLVHHPVAPAVLGVVYGALLVTGTEPPAGASMSSLSGVSALFTVPRIVTAGWIHYLIFDLFVGAWEARDALRRGIPHWLLVPCLVLTLMFGPLGLLVYLSLRFARARVLGFEEGPAAAS